MRLIPWVTTLVYSVVLFAGLYYVVADLSPGSNDPLRLTGFVVCILLLFVVERIDSLYVEWELAARLTLYIGVIALDESGLSRILFLLVPFVAYLEIGRRVGLWLAVACLVLLLAGYLIWVPGWYAKASYVSDVLMFCVGMILALGMAAVAASALLARSHIVEMIADMERSRMARDIHDSLGHHLTAISVQLEKSTMFRERDPEAADQAVAHAHEAVRRALAEVRTAVSAFREGTTPFDLPGKLAELAQGSSAELTVVGEQAGARPVLNTLYRAAQESLTNARRHAQASTVSMKLTFNSMDARLEVVDDGMGFNVYEPRGNGLQGMQERAEMLGGTMKVSSKLGKGTRITVTVPT
jgi:signal transduction histidine kinase